MKTSLSLFAIVLLVVSLLSPMAAAQYDSPNVVSSNSANKEEISVKQYVKNGNSVWKLQKGTRLYLLQEPNHAVDPALENVVKLVNAEMAAKNLPSAEPLPIHTGTESLMEAGDIVIRLGKLSETSNTEAYKLEINDKVTLTAPTVRGILYGLRTIEQQLLVSSDLSYGTIVDYPALPERSFHIDMARKFYTKDWLIQQIKESSWLKINTVQLHFSENEGFRLESKVHPEVMSPEYITQAEMKEILAVAKQYQVDIIPSFDSPGHLQYLLRNHPEWKLKDSSGNACTTTEVCKGALDITNADAKAYIFDLLDEYAELFKDSKYFHIGGDEFIDFNNFDRFPQLQDYARNVLGIANGTGIDTFIDYTNKVAEHMEKKGFVTRVWNDGYFRDNQTERVALKKSIQIDYWTKWESHMAPVQKFIDEGFDLINFNDAYFYYVLGENAGYKYPTGAKIYDGWHPGLFPSVSSTVKQEYNEPYPSSIVGASFAIWSDTPTAQTQEQVSAGIYEPLRAMAEKAWIADKRYTDYAAFKSVLDKIGQVPGYDRALPTASVIAEAKNMGTIHIKAVDDNGRALYDSRMFGPIGSDYTVKPDNIYGYSLDNMPSNASGTFGSAAATVTLVYVLKTDKSALQQAYEQVAAYPAKNYIAASYTPYEQQLQQTKAVLDDSRATQTTVDNMLKQVQQAQNQLIHRSKMQLYVLIQFPQAQQDSTSTSYAAYTNSIQQAKPLLTDANTSVQDIQTAVDRIITAMQNLRPPAVKVTMNDNLNINFDAALDGNSDTYAANWDPQKVGDTIVFDFAKPVNLSTFTIQYYANYNYGRIKKADFQIAQSVSGTLQWKTVGTLDNSAETIKLDINQNDVQQARIVYTADTLDNYEGTIISELSFGFLPGEDDSDIQQLRAIDIEPNSIHLQWNAVNRASSYTVYANDDPQPIYTGSDPSFVHTNLQPDTVYTYRVMYMNGGVASIPYFVEIKTAVAPEMTTTTLSALRIDQGQLSPAFDPSIRSYTARVASDVYTLDFTVGKSDPEQQLNVTGATYRPSITANSYSYWVDLTKPQQSVTIEVYSPSGMTGNYTLLIMRSDTPWFSTKLSGLHLANGSLTPAFSPEVSRYSTSVASNVSRTTVTAEVYDTSSILTINGKSATSGQGHNVELQTGNNAITVTVQARDRQSQTYTITVTRQSSSGSGGSSGSSGTVPGTASLVSSDNGRLTVNSSQSGQVRMDDQLLISIPAGASSDPLTIIMSRLNTNEQPAIGNSILLSPVYELLKNTPSRFIRPVTLSFTFDPAQIGPNQKAAIFYYDESAKRWIEVGGKVQGNVITADVNHFTKFAVMAIGTMPDILSTEPPVTRPEPTVTFNDISSHWAATSIQRAITLGIVKGYADGTFLPNKPVTRAEFVVMLNQALKLPTNGRTASFKDATQIGIWAHQAINTAVQEGIVTGYPDNTFRPNAIITRAEMARILAKAMKQTGSGTATTTGFADQNSIPTWAQSSVHWLHEQGIIQGRADNRFMPKASATRAESITIILNMLDAKQ